jgi:hypothetical protein
MFCVNLGYDGVSTIVADRSYLSSGADFWEDISKKFYRDPYFRKFAEIGYPELDMTVPFYRNIAPNHSFEGGTVGSAPTDWANWRGATAVEKSPADGSDGNPNIGGPYDGSYAMYVDSGGVNKGTATIALAYKEGKTYRIICYVYVVNGRCRVMLHCSGSVGWQDITTTGSWQKAEFTFTANGVTTSYIRFIDPDGSSDFYVDFVKIYIDESESAWKGECESQDPYITSGGNIARARCTSAVDDGSAIGGPHSGSKCIKVTTNHTGTNYFQYAPQSAINDDRWDGKLLEVSVWIYLPSGQDVTSISMSLYHRDKSDSYTHCFPSPNPNIGGTYDQWVNLKAVGYVPPGNTKCLYVWITTNSCDLNDGVEHFYVDDLEIHEVGCVADWDWSDPSNWLKDKTVNENHLTAHGTNRELVSFVYPKGGKQEAIHPWIM